MLECCLIQANGVIAIRKGLKDTNKFLWLQLPFHLFSELKLLEITLLLFKQGSFTLVKMLKISFCHARDESAEKCSRSNFQVSADKKPLSFRFGFNPMNS